MTSQELSIDEAVELAIGHHQAGRLSDAQNIYRQILDVDPGNADALHYLGVIAHQSGDSQAAVTLIQRAIQEAPQAAPYYSNLGEAQRALGDLDAAIASYRRAIEVDPGFAMAHNNLGNILADAGRLEDAFACYKQAAALQPDDPEIRLNKANLLAEMNRLTDAIQDYRQLLETFPQFPVAWNAFGIVLEADGNIDEATRAFQAAVELTPDFDEARTNLDRVQFEIQKSLLNRADRDRAQGKWADAASIYEKVIASQPDHAAAIYGLGLCHSGMGETREALAALDEAVRIQPFFEDALAALGEILLSQEKTHSSTEPLGVDRQPVIWTALAIAHFRAERFAQAEYAAEQSVPGLTAALKRDGENNEAWTLLGLALRAIRDVAKSEQLLRAQLRLLDL